MSDSTKPILDQPYSPANLQQLLKISDAYKALNSDEQANIQAHIHSNNKPVLIFIYQKLIEEQKSYQISLNQLVQKISKLKLDAADQANFNKSLSESF